jgi:hypothetical protein
MAFSATGNVRQRPSAPLAPLVQWPPALRRQPEFDFRAHFYHSAPMETHAFGFRLRANAPEGLKRFSYQSTVNLKVRLILRSGLTR